MVVSLVFRHRGGGCGASHTIAEAIQSGASENSLKMDGFEDKKEPGKIIAATGDQQQHGSGRDQTGLRAHHSDGVCPSRTVKVFLSSTFTDMYSEREAVVSSVIPLVQEWANRETELERLGCYVHLMTVDLRWGVVADATPDVTFRTCLGEVERCRELEPNDDPVFICFLSERVGWVPTSEEVKNVRDELGWVDDYSVTEMEIESAVFRDGNGNPRPNPNPNALVCFRDPSFLDGLDSSRVECYYRRYKRDGEEKHARETRTRLKRQLPSAQQFEYTIQFQPHYDQFNAKGGDVSYPVMDGLDDFEQRITTFLKDYLTKTWSTETGVGTSVTNNMDPHKTFVVKAGAMASRSDLVDKLLFPVWDNADVSVERNGEGEGLDTSGSGSVSILTGEAGIGKSSVMAQLCQCIGVGTNAQRQDVVYCFCHFVGATALSVNPQDLVRRLIEHCREWRGGDPGAPGDAIPTDTGKLVDLCRVELVELSTWLLQSGCRAVVVIDAMNQLVDSPPGVFQHLRWLPFPLPSNIHVIASVLDNPNHPSPGSYLAGFEDMSKRESMAERYRIVKATRLSPELKGDILQLFMKAATKTLSNIQHNMLLSKKDSDNPLWLRLASEELRVFGVFEAVDRLISDLNDSLFGLVEQVLERLCAKSRCGPEAVRDCLCLIQVSRYGLLESELDAMLALEPTETLVMFASLRPYLRSAGARGEGRVDFIHRIFSKVIKSCWLGDANHSSTREGTEGADDGVQGSKVSAAKANTKLGDREALYRRRITTFMQRLTRTNERVTTFIQRLSGTKASATSRGIEQNDTVGTGAVAMHNLRRVLEELPHQQQLLGDVEGLEKTVAKNIVIFGGLEEHFKMDLHRYWRYLVTDMADMADSIPSKSLCLCACDTTNVRYHLEYCLLAAKFLLEKGNFEESLSIIETLYADVGDKRDQTAAEIANTRGRLHDAKGEYDAALRLYNESIDVYRHFHGANHPDIASALTNKARVHESRGEYDVALLLHNESLDMYRHFHGDNHPDIAETLHNIAVVHKSLGEYDAALRVYNESLAMKRHFHGANHPSIAETLRKIGVVHESRGEYEVALRVYNESLNMYRHFHGANHPDIATTLHNIAVIHVRQSDSQSDMDTALRLFKESLDMKRRFLGANHPDIAMTLHCIGVVHDIRGDHDAALRLLNDTLDMYRRFHGANHPDIAMTLQGIARVQESRGDSDAALRLENESLDMLRRFHGAKHPDIATTLREIAGVHENRGEYDAALRLYNESLDMYRHFHGANHPSIAFTAEQIARVQHRCSTI